MESGCQDDCREWSSEPDFTEMVKLAEISKIASAFMSLMYEILILQTEIAFAVGAFAVGAVSRVVADIGFEHRGTL